MTSCVHPWTKKLLPYINFTPMINLFRVIFACKHFSGCTCYEMSTFMDSDQAKHGHTWAHNNQHKYIMTSINTSVKICLWGAIKLQLINIGIFNTWISAKGFSRLLMRAASCCFSSSTMSVKVTGTTDDLFLLSDESQGLQGVKREGHNPGIHV